MGDIIKVSEYVVLRALINYIKKLDPTVSDTNRPYQYCHFCMYTWRVEEEPTHSEFCNYYNAIKAIQEFEEESNK